MKFVKPVNVVSIGHVVVVYRANVVKEKYVSWIYVCVVHNVVVAVHMNIVLMKDVFARQVYVINVTMRVNQMKFVSMENVFVKNNVKKVDNEKFDVLLFRYIVAFCPFPCLNGGRCTGFYQCTCRQGWQGHRCEQRQTKNVTMS
jgi:hypothetical protein